MKVVLIKGLGDSSYKGLGDSLARPIARCLLNSRLVVAFHRWAFPPPKCQRLGCHGPCDNMFHNASVGRETAR